MALCGIEIGVETADLMLQMNDMVVEKRGKSDLRIIAKIIASVKQNYQHEDKAKKQ